MTSPFPLPMAFVAWGTAPGKDWEGGSIGGGLFTPAKDAKVATIAFEIGQCSSTHVRWAHESGFFVVLWGVAGAGLGAELDALSYTDLSGAKRGPDGVMPQVEGPGQYDGALLGLTAIKGRPLPKAIVTTYGGLVNEATPTDGKKYAALRALGVRGCYVESYASDAPGHEDLDRMLGQGVIYGIPEAELLAVCGVFRGEMPSAYKGLGKLGRNFSLYLAEAMTTAQWEAWGEVPPVPTPTPIPVPTVKLAYWRLTAGASLLHEERAKTYPDASTGLGRMLLWMERNAAVIRNAKAVDLVHVLR